MNRSAIAAATATAKRVFPTPPGPVRLNSRTSGRISNSVARATSSSRPMSEVRGIGRSWRFLATSPEDDSRPSDMPNNSIAGESPVFDGDLITGALNTYPRRGTVFSNFWARSSSARRSSTVHCTRESSVTKASGHTAWINSCLPISRPGCSTRYLRAS